MSDQQKRGFRLPWAAERGADEVSAAATADQETLDSAPAAVGDDLGEGPFHRAESEPAMKTDAAPDAFEVPEDSAEAEMIDTDAMQDRIERAAGGTVRDKVIGVLGATFKPNTDDMREAASLTIVPLLTGKGAQVSIYDPQGWRHGPALLEGAKWCKSAFEAAKQADVVVVLTEWNEFRAIDLGELKRTMRGDLLVDTRNIYQPDQALAAGLRYLGIGRATEVAEVTPSSARQRASG